MLLAGQDVLPVRHLRCNGSSFGNVSSAGVEPTVNAANNVTLASGTHTGAVIPTVSTLTGHTAQTGDTFAQLPPNFSNLGIESDGDLTKVNTLDGHTAQTGDSYAIVNSGTYGNAAQLDNINYALAVLAGTISNAGEGTETFSLTVSGATYQVQITGLDTSGNRTGQTLSKS